MSGQDNRSAAGRPSPNQNAANGVAPHWLAQQPPPLRYFHPQAPAYHAVPGQIFYMPGKQFDRYQRHVIEIQKLGLDGRVQRHRLPPRSRNGCWTCRGRKVKCDEIKPICGQCTRLSHNCDYTSRVSFRADTTRVRSRVEDIVLEGSPWDEKLKDLPFVKRKPHLPHIDADTLPDYWQLRDDDEREMKAMGVLPGTFYVLCNPKSFGYEGPEIRWTPKLTFLPPHKYLPINDPDIIQLDHIEDSSPCRPTNPRASVTALARSRKSVSEIPTPSSSRSTQNSFDQRGSRVYIDYYQLRLSPRVLLAHDESLKSEQTDIFHERAHRSQQLYHALNALAALCAQKENGVLHDSHPIEHYSMALSFLSVTAEEGLRSDELVFLHYLLLLYEIISDSGRRKCLWNMHLGQLTHIIVNRGSATKMTGHRETLPYVLWNLAVLDAYTAMTAGGTGKLVEELLAQGLMPNAEEMVHDIPASPERMRLQGVLDFQQQIILVAARLARHAHFSRRLSKPGDVTRCTQPVGELMSELRAHWEHKRPSWTRCYTYETPNVHGIQQKPQRSQELFEHAVALYNTCIIFGHTSLWPGQRKNLSAAASLAVTSAIEKIACQCTALSGQSQLDRRFLAFPLFLAAVMAERHEDKIWFKNELEEIEKLSFGFNIKVATTVLQAIIDKQNDITGSNADDIDDVDWLTYAVENKVVIWGL